MAYAGLESIFQNEGPLSGGMYQGQREAMGTADSLLSQQKQMLDNQNSATMNPLNAQFRQGEIAAQAPALSLAQTNATKAAGTLNSDIEAGNSNNRATIDSNQFKTLTNMGKMAGVIGTMLSQTPPGLERQTATAQVMQQAGIHPESKVGQYILNNPPEKLIDIAKQIEQMSGEFIRSHDTAQVTAQSHLQGIDKTTASQERINQANIDAGRWKPKTTASFAIKFMSLSPDRQMTELAQALRTNKNPFTGEDLNDDERDGLITRYKQAEALVKGGWAAKGAGGIDAAATSGLPPKPVPEAAVDVSPKGPTTQTPNSPSVPQQQITEAFGSYEPNKYEYRVNPSTGKLQRKAK